MLVELRNFLQGYVMKLIRLSPWSSPEQDKDGKHTTSCLSARIDPLLEATAAAHRLSR
jgi:hypothetical protein